MADSQPPEGLQPKIGDEEEIRRAIGGVLVCFSNTLDDIDDLTQWHPCEPTCSRKCGCSGIPYVSDALWEQLKPILSGRLLPSGGEVSTQWGVRWHAVPDQDEWDDWGFLDEAQAREEMASSPTPSTLLRRRTITLPVEPVLSDNSEVPNG